MNFKRFVVMTAAVGITCGVQADGFEWLEVTNSAVKNLLQPNTNNFLPYFAVANAGSDGGFMCVGSNFIASLATTNIPLTTTNGGYLLETNGWVNVITNSYTNVYLNCVTYGSGMFVAAGKTNATFAFAPGQGWSQPKNANIKANYDAKGIAYNPVSQTFALVTSSLKAAYASGSNWAPGNSLAWEPADTINSAVVESFRGVTAMGGSSFALCGIYEDIRLSADGGTNWVQNRTINLSAPTNLLAIASDGAQTLVAVGEHNTLQVSVNTGTNWATTALSNAVAGSTFNAATYTGPDDRHFIVVGTGGQIYSCTNDPAVIVNGANWLKITNGLTASVTNNLLGVSYAASGPFQGIGMVVGGNGTIIIGGTPPPAPSNTNDPVTNILGLAYQTLQPTIETNTLHPAVSTTIDWFTDKVGGTLLASGQVAFTPTNVNCGIYTNYAEARDARTGLGNTNRIGFIFYVIPPAPTSTTGWTNLLTQPFQINPPLLASVFTDNDNPYNYFQVQWFTEPNELSLITSLSETTNFNQFGYKPVNALCGTYTNWARTIAVTTSPPGIPNLVSTNWTPVVFTVIPPAPTNAFAVSTMTNVLTASPQMNKALGVDLLVNASNPPSNFVVDWYSNPTGPTLLNNGTENNNGNVFYHTPDTYQTCGVYTNWAETRATNTLPSGTDVVSTNRTSVTFVIVPQQPVNPIGWTNVLTAPNQTNAYLCVNVVTNSDNPVSAFSVDWFADPGATIPLLNGSEINVGTQFCFIPTNNVCGTYTVFARTRAVTTTPVGISLVSTGMTQVVFRLIPPAPFNPVGATNCAYNPVFGCANPALTIEVFTNVYNPPDTLQANWYVSPTGGNVAYSSGNIPGMNTLSFIPTNSSPTNITFWVEAMDKASGLTSSSRTPVTFLIKPLPQAPSWTLGDTNCDGTPNGTLQANFIPGDTNMITEGTVVVDWYDGATNGANLLWTGDAFTPTNKLTSLDDNHASTNVFYAQARVIDPTFNGCICSSTNRVPVVLLVNPRPKVVLNPFNSTNCNDGTWFKLTNTLTGIGPWIITWNDGFTQTNPAVAGPSTYARTVYPTNWAGATMASNNVYYVTSVVTTNSCMGNQLGDILGTNVLTINPRPAAVVSGSTTLSIVSNEMVTATIQASVTDLTNAGPWSIEWNDGVVQTSNSMTITRTVTTNLSASTIQYYVFQMYKGGPNPNYYGSYLIESLSQAGVSQATSGTHKNQYKYNKNSNSSYYYGTDTKGDIAGYVTNIISSSLTSLTNSFWLTGLTNYNFCMSLPSDLTGTATVVLVSSPGAVVSALGDTNICQGNSIQIQAQLSGASPWTNTWFGTDGTLVTNVSTSSLEVFSVTPTNLGTVTYYITNLVDGLGRVATNSQLGSSVIFTVYSVPTNMPVSSGDQTNCAGVLPNPTLYVTDTNPGVSINWFDSDLDLVATNTTSYTPTVSAPGIYTNWVAEVNASGCAGNYTQVNLILLDCSNPPKIQFNGTNGTIQWFGNLTLQSTTNLAPAVWVNVTNGGLGTNTWLLTNSVSPQNFFRLGITNAP